MLIDLILAIPITLVELTIAFLGFAILIYQLRKIQQSMRISAQGDLYSINATLRTLIVQHPHVRPYILEKRELDHLNENERAQVVTVAEMLLNYLEHLVIQRKVFDKSDWNSWANLIEKWVSEHPLLKELLLQYPERYSDDLYKVAKISKPRVKPVPTSWYQRLQQRLQRLLRVLERKDA